MRAPGRRIDPALSPFFWSRAAIWALAVVFVFAFEPDSPRRHGPTPGGHGYWLDLWGNWDGAWYRRVAEHGYGAHDGTAAFYPLYSGLLAGLGRVFGGHYVAAGIVLSLAAAAVAFVMLRRLTALELGDETARRATVLLAVFPACLFLQAVYSEALFLALAVGAFYAARLERWPLAALATAAAFLTRPTAFALWAGVLVLAWRSHARGRALAWTVPAPLAFGVYPLLLWQQTGDAAAFAHAESFWHRSLSSLGPLGGIVDGARAAAHGLHAVVATSTPANWTYPANLDLKQVAAVNVEAFAYLLLFLALTVVAWRRLGAAYGVFAALSLALPLSEPWNVFPLFSLPRFGLVVFPFVMALATLTRSHRVYVAVVACSIALLAFNVYRWALWYWVA
jgi:Mannosyltransferase (PIG-V)